MIHVTTYDSAGRVLETGSFKSQTKAHVFGQANEMATSYKITDQRGSETTFDYDVDETTDKGFWMQVDNE